MLSGKVGERMARAGLQSGGALQVDQDDRAAALGAAHNASPAERPSAMARSSAISSTVNPS